MIQRARHLATVLRGAVTFEKHVVGRSWSIPDRQAGRGYVKDQGRQNLLITTMRIFGVKVLSWTSDVEDVPWDVVISLGCFGDTGGWASRFLPYFKR